MRTNARYRKAALSIVLLCTAYLAIGQSTYIPADSIAPSTLSYEFSGGSFESYGCSGIDPTYWMWGSGNSATVTFVNAQTYPSIRVWGMNDDDTAQVFVNAIPYPLNSSSATYDAKVICNEEFGSPGSEGVVFSSGLLVGANSNSTGNYSYQNVTITSPNVSSITVLGRSGNGWGFAGVTAFVEPTGIQSLESDLPLIEVFPNPTSDKVQLRRGNDHSEFEIELFNALGQSILQQGYQGEESVTLDLSQFQSGFYFLVYRTAHETITQKIFRR